jgi:hypothetical protein
MTTITKKEFSFGTVLSESISVFFSNLLPFVVVALVVLLPLLVYNLVVIGTPDPTAGAYSGGALLAIVLQMVLSQLMAATIAYGTFQYLRGHPISIGECLSRGLALILPVLGVAILAGLITGIGMLLLVIPGIIAAVMLWVVIPVAVVERPGVIASLRRSVELTKGYRLTIFGILIVIGLILVVISFILGFILASAAGYTVYNIGIWVLQAVIGAFSATAAAVGYYYLRGAKEGIDIGEIARVFD